MAGFRVSIAALALVSTAAAQVVPSIEANGVNITIDAPVGDVLINTRSRTGQPPVSMSEMMSKMATMTSQMVEMSSRVQQLQQQLDPDNQDGWRNDIEARVGGLPTGQEIADQYLTPTAAADMYATQTTVRLIRTELNALVAAASSGDDDAFPLCDPLPVPTRGNTTDHEEHVPGTVVGISCNEGYAQTGATEAICLSNTTWAYRGAAPNCSACATQWLDVPWALDRFENIQGPGSRGRDYRTGNPRTTSSFNLPAIDIGSNGVSGFRFYFQYVTGYGRCGDECTNSPPRIRVYLQNAEDETDRILAWDSDTTDGSGIRLDGQGCPPLTDAQNPDGFQGGCDYDSCGNRGWWGSDDNGNDGCYSQRIFVNKPNLSGLASATRATVFFTIDNRDRNLHINEDLMNVQINARACPQ
jgi:hypothetical protein